MTAAQSSLEPAVREHWAFSDGASGLLFDRQSMSVHPLAPDLASVFDEILEGAGVIVPGSHEDVVLGEILRAFRDRRQPSPLTGLASLEHPAALRDMRRRTRADRYLNKLAINVANDCNLACTYCYANKGLYGTPHRSLLSGDDVEHYITRFAEKYDFIESIQFMGGEPSMNSIVIRRTGAVFRRLVSEGRLVGEPRYTLVTNGVSFTSDFLQVCSELKIELTVSLDGPEAVHDAARVRRNGAGSYAAVRKSIARAQAAGIELEFEPTFSRAHLRQGMSLIDLVEWFHAEFGVVTLHAPPMSENRYETDGLGLTADDKLREYCAVTEWGIDNLLERKRYLMHTFTARILESLETRRPNTHLCPAGHSMLSISTGGEVSPCWMYTDEKSFAIGHVDDDDFLGERARAVSEIISRNELHSHPECAVCAVRPMCFGCKGGDYHATGTASGKINCDYMRAMIVTAIMRVYSRPDLPATSADYYGRPSFGETIYERLRPAHAPSQSHRCGQSACECRQQ